MVIIQVAGGLGNQLQQYALYREFLNIGTEAKLDISWFKSEDLKSKSKEGTVTERRLELACFEGLDYEICSEEEKKTLIGSNGIKGKLRRKLFPQSVHWFHETRMYHPEIFAFRDMYISGYFACEKYYQDLLGKFREEIKFPLSKNSLNQKLAEEMINSQSVSMHIRRGDYLSTENSEMFGNICTDAYYEKAIEIIKEKIPNAYFYIFSDDVPYVKEKYAGEKRTIVDINHGKDSFYDMWLMSRCKHNICANSTFSFWGARLNGNEEKIMIRPTIHKNMQIFDKDQMEKLWPGWRFIDPQGKPM